MINRTFQEFKNDLFFHRTQIKFLLQKSPLNWLHGKNVESHKQEIKQIYEDWEFYNPIKKRLTSANN